MSVLKYKDALGNWNEINTIKGDTGATGAQGAQGIPGVSPTIAVEDIPGGHRVTITDADHPGGISFDVMDGSDADAPVKGVSINGTSIVDAQGNADIPAATSSAPGAVKVNSGYGMYMNGWDIRTVSAYQSEVKAGAHQYRMITPSNQDQSAFYGLAKIAGSDEKNSTLPVGQYTDAAKVAIQKMLGVYEAPWELIREDTFTNETEADHVIEVDASGQTFELTDAILLFETPKQNNVSGLGGSGIIRFVSSTDYLDTYVGPYTQEANASARGGNAYLERKKGGLIITKARTQISSTNGASLTQRYYEGFTKPGTPVMLYDDFIIIRVRIVRVTGTGHYRLFGKRRWQ